jgi:hypothetical protein
VLPDFKRVDSRGTSVRDSPVMITTAPTTSGRRLFLFGILCLLSFTSFGCAGALYKVKPVVDLPPLPDSSMSAESGGIKFRVAPLLTDEESQDLFEANLPVAGVLPLRMELTYEGSTPIEIKKARFRLRDGEGHEWKLSSAKKATSRILKSNGITTYNPNSRKQFEKEIGAYEIDLKTPLTSSEGPRRGFLFFLSPENKMIESPAGLTLTIERLPQPVEIKLN